MTKFSFYEQIHVYIYMCVCVYMYICIYVCIYVCVYMYVCICMCVYMYVCIYVCVCTYIYIYIYIYNEIKWSGLIFFRNSWYKFSQINMADFHLNLAYCKHVKKRLKINDTRKKQDKYCEKHDHWYKIWQNKSWNKALLFIYLSSVQGRATLPWTIFVIIQELLKVWR